MAHDFTISPADIKQARTALGMNQIKFAEILNVHPMTVSKWERGETTPDSSQQDIIRKCITIAKNRETAKKTGKHVLAALAGAGFATAIYYLLKAAFNSEPHEEDENKNGNKKGD